VFQLFFCGTLDDELSGTDGGAESGGTRESGATLIIGPGSKSRIETEGFDVGSAGIDAGPRLSGTGGKDIAPRVLMEGAVVRR
jgi:hypothetical protein